MAQFDVHRNRGRNRNAIPFVWSSNPLSTAPIEVAWSFPWYVAGLSQLPHLALDPVFSGENVEVILYPLESVSLACDQQGEPVGSPATEGNRITAALDEMLTQRGVDGEDGIWLHIAYR